MMRHLFLIFFLILSPLFASSIDPASRHFRLKEEKKYRMDTFDFSGEYPDLEDIEINARRKKAVELVLTGSYPILNEVYYEGSFGELTADLTGDFPNLTKVSILCTSCAMDLDFRGKWEKSCEINITGMKEDLVLNIPHDVNIIINAKTGAKGKIIAEGFQKKKKFRLFKKKYVSFVEDCPITLVFHVETTEGRILLR